jgi:hypothetical protein
MLPIARVKWLQAVIWIGVLTLALATWLAVFELSSRDRKETPARNAIPPT